MSARFSVRLSAFVLSALTSFIPVSSAQTAPRPANGNGLYQQLRHLLPGGETVEVKEFTLKRDAGVFTFHSGSFAFYGEVNGKITGAVFRGQGELHMVPPSAEEKRSIALLTRQPELDETFTTAVLRFSDDTAAEIRKAAAGKGAAQPAMTSDGQQFAKALRTDLHWNLDARLLEDVTSPAPGGFFLASIDGKKYASKMLYIVDPGGAVGVAPEEVELMTWNDNRNGIWAAFHYQDEYRDGIPNGNEANDSYSIDHEDLDTTIAKNGMLSATAKVTVHIQADGTAVLPMRLYSTLRVSGVQNTDGTQLDYIQEDKDAEPDFAVILPAAMKKNQTTQLRITYSGKDVVVNEGTGNYYLISAARESWYPNSAKSGLSSYATFHMLFHVPKTIEMVATGTPARKPSTNESDSEWTTDEPIPVAGFNLGRFREQDATLKDGFTVDAYANDGLPDSFNAIRGSGGSVLGSMDTTPMLKPALAQGAVALQVYSQYFGPLPYHRLALTQQSACNYGQSWPMLVYLPICGFWDGTVQHVLGLDSDHMYWKVVTPHEVAHQWWGQTVSFRSYRDQWMSEGFADFSASIFLQVVNKTDHEYRDFWQQQRRLLIEKNKEGFRPIDVGPVTMGYRLVNSKSGENVYQDLVYPKGAYILHMIRLMGWSPKTGDAWFQQTMQDFINTYRSQPATTEDFKAVLEKHLPPSMDLDGNHRLDWFFNEYVYGTALPHYAFTSELKPGPDRIMASFSLTQSNVDASFRMLIPVYAELNDGRVIRIGNATVVGNTTVSKQFSMGQSKIGIKRLLINYNYDVLSTQD
ncbi:M1 family metallopeptidase [Silvibacterium sp.]|uniref:M1 family metallopeptidase n=1 Tax=Silvibacterium sp. TaxID=1964179 RepID=UPI0039E699C3